MDGLRRQFRDALVGQELLDFGDRSWYQSEGQPQHQLVLVQFRLPSKPPALRELFAHSMSFQLTWNALS